MTLPSVPPYDRSDGETGVESAVQAVRGLPAGEIETKQEGQARHPASASDR